MNQAALNNRGPDVAPNVPGPFAGGNMGWLGRVTVGDKEVRHLGDWNVHAGYKYLESDATIDAFVDSDFGLGGTNLKGYFLGRQLRPQRERLDDGALDERHRDRRRALRCRRPASRPQRKVLIMTKRIIQLAVFASLSATMLSSVAHADTETDRLREALRSATAQTRQLEDQRTALQVRVARYRPARKQLPKPRSTRPRPRSAISRNSTAKRSRSSTSASPSRDETLEKWKTAYEEAATVARAKDAERARFEGQATAYKASVKSCVAKNGELIKAGRDLLQRYRSVTIGDTIVAQEPALGMRRVDIQNELQTTNDKFLDQKATP